MSVVPEPKMIRSKQAPPHLRSALTQRDAIAVIATFAILIVLFMIMLPSMREWSGRGPRARCAANLKGIGTGAYTYASENREEWPNCVPSAPKHEEPRFHVTYAPGLIGKNRNTPDDDLVARASGGQLAISVTRNLWILVRWQASTPKSFTCPDSDDVPNKDTTPASAWDFRGYNEVSYGIQIPFGRFGQPSVDCDQRMIILADKGPYGAAIEAGKPNPGPPNAGATGTPQQWKPWNSPNHSGSGQNVLFADGHADWVTQPNVGVNGDNIYTRWSAPAGSAASGTDDPLPRIHGMPPTGTEVPMAETDTLLYP